MGYRRMCEVTRKIVQVRLVCVRRFKDDINDGRSLSEFRLWSVVVERRVRFGVPRSTATIDVSHLLRGRHAGGGGRHLGGGGWRSGERRSQRRRRPDSAGGDGLSLALYKTEAI